MAGEILPSYVMSPRDILVFGRGLKEAEARFFAEFLKTSVVRKRCAQRQVFSFFRFSVLKLKQLLNPRRLSNLAKGVFHILTVFWLVPEEKSLLI